jgi:hypothetical protein
MSDRIFYAIQAVGIEGADTGTGVITWLHGVQSVGVTTNFNLEQVFELGQLALYQNVENVPEPCDKAFNKIIKISKKDNVK